MKNTLVFVLGGGRGTRLFPLTQMRSKPAVPLAGRYRLIDIPISNCINSGLNQIYLLTQFLSVSLHRHIRQTYRFDPFSGGFVEILAAQQTMEAGTDWYQGTADAVRKNLRYLIQPPVEDVLILSGDQLYRMDYQELLQTHRRSGADVSIAALPVSTEQAGSFGVIRVDESGRVVGFLEKPQQQHEVRSMTLAPEWLRSRGLATDAPHCLASMGIYVFKRQTLVDALDKTDYRDFGREVFPAAVRSRRVQVYLFDGYWEDIGTIRAYYDANLAMARSDAHFNFFHPDLPVYTRARFLPPTRAENCTVQDSFICEGCQIGRNVVIENSVIGVRSILGDGVTIRKSVLLGADDFTRHGTDVPLGIGEGTHIEGAIIDKNCCIGRNVRIDNPARVVQRDIKQVCFIRDGIPVIIKDAVLPDGWRMGPDC